MSTSSSASYGTVTVGTSATRIVAGKSLRGSVIIQNVHASNILYLGDDDQVATASGLRLNAGESITLWGFNGNVYGIASAASTDVRYFEVG